MFQFTRRYLWQILLEGGHGEDHWCSHGPVVITVGRRSQTVSGADADQHLTERSFILTWSLHRWQDWDLRWCLDYRRSPGTSLGVPWTSLEVRQTESFHPSVMTDTWPVIVWAVTFGNLAGVPHSSAERHADVHGVGGGVWQVFCSAVHRSTAHRLRRLAAGTGARLRPLQTRRLCITEETTETLKSKGNVTIES